MAVHGREQKELLMRIALDYDNTYTRDTHLWDGFIDSAKARGHEVICVTMRHDVMEERIDCGLVNRVVYTGREAKKPFLEKYGVKIDIWIDDSPHWILQNG